MKNVYSLLLLLSAFLVNSCTVTRYVPVESVRVDSVCVSQIQRDSIYERDSIFVAIKADTVFLTKTKYRYRDRVLRDTVRVLRCDTIVRVVEAEKEPGFWQKKKLRLAEMALWLSLFAILYVIFRLKVSRKY